MHVDVRLCRRIGTALLLTLTAACTSEAPAPSTTTSAPSAVPPRARPVQQAAPRSAESEALVQYYARVQSDLLAQGLMRLDGGGPDTPFDTRMLTENFIRIALYDEYQTLPGGNRIARAQPSVLRRWAGPIRMSVEFGASVPLEQRARDGSMVAGYATRLSLLTGVPLTMTTPDRANFHVLILNEDERRAFGPRLRQIVPGINDADVRGVTDIDRSTFCFAFAYSEQGQATYRQAVALIRGEHPDLLRRSCVHEELAQAMGLVNDSPQARPSIFNDDEEFALLTKQDELMLKMLYDPRLRPGMTPEEARPIVEVIAAELLPAGG